MNIQSFLERNDTKAIKYYCLCLFIVSFGLYSNSLKNEYSLDDNIAIYTNKYVLAGFDKIDKIFTTPFYYGSLGEKGDNQIYRPIVTLSFAADIALFGNKPFFVHHFINVVLFSISVVLIFLTILKFARSNTIVFAFLTAFFFAIHPIHTEVVANIKSRDEIFSLLFGLLIPLYVILHYLENKKKVLLYIATLSYAVGLFSKENTVTFIVLFPLLIFLFTNTKKAEAFKIIFPLFLILIIYLVIHYLVLAKFPINDNTIVMNILFGAKTIESYCATALVGMLIYLKLLIFPSPLIWDYSFNHVPLTDFTDSLVLTSLLIHIGLIILFFFSLRKNPFVSFCIAFYFITISINSNLIITTGAFLGERFLYTPSLAVCMALSSIILTDWRFPIIQKAKPILIIIIVILSSNKIITRNKEWKDTLTIALADIDKAPGSLKIQGTLASSFSKLTPQITEENDRVAIYHKMIDCYNKMNSVYPYMSDTWLSLGSTYANLKKYNQAIECFNKAEHLDPENYKLYKYRAEMNLILGSMESALSDLLKYSKYRNDDDTSNYNLGWLYYRKKELDKAAPLLTKASNNNLFQKNSYSMLSDIYEQKKDLQHALLYYTKLMEIAPSEDLAKKITALKEMIFEEILNKH